MTKLEGRKMREKRKKARFGGWSRICRPCGTAQCSVLRPNKGPPVYTRSLANTLQLSYKRISLQEEEKEEEEEDDGPFLWRSIMGERRTKRNSARFTREKREDGKEEEGRWRWRDEERERDEACIDLSSLPLPHPLPFSNFRSA